MTNLEIVTTSVEQFEKKFAHQLAHKQWNTTLLQEFQDALWKYYQEHKRDFAWRSNPTEYYVVVSEVMLQQTQTIRVIEKFQQFIQAFPTWHSLAQATAQQVLQVWVGLGYNRRGLYLHQIAQKIVAEYNAVLPNEVAVLKTFKGLGHATASSIIAFAYNTPTVFIETNIRSVFLHVFFKNEEEVSDALIEPLVALTLKQDNPREWYYGLMDYGVYLKKKHKNPNRKSKHYTKQSKFEGSTRQVRAAIVKTLAFKTVITLEELHQALPYESEKIDQQLEKLCVEKIISLKNNTYSLL